MNTFCGKARRAGTALALALLIAPDARAEIMGVMGPSFVLRASDGLISSSDSDSIYAWGYGVDDGTMATMQYPGPTLIVNQGDVVTIDLTNDLTLPVSIVFPGQRNIVSMGGTPGLLAQEAPANGGTVHYTFVAERAGTYLYHSGTLPELEIEMGLFGALIVRPAGAAGQAYEHPATAFDHEYLFLLSEIDPTVHDLAQLGLYQQIDNTVYRPVSWAINGRMAPDTMLENAPWLPRQPYDCMPRMHPGEKVLMRLLGAGRDAHPFHTHGNNMTVIARDGRLLESAPAAGPDLALSDYTLTVSPGATYDAFWTWTGEKLGWDIYGHASALDPMQPGEYALDHGKPFPVVLPSQGSLTFGPHYSGSPFLGTYGTLPPGAGGFNENAGLFFMFHSHTERELVTNDIFPGGMMTMMIIEPPGVAIP